jgi:DNA-directed RNA polymerase subunit E'/Rpb7
MDTENKNIIRSIGLHPKNAYTNLENNLFEKAKKEYENKCWSEGFIVSVNKIVNRTQGKVNNLAFDGFIMYNVLLNVEIANPQKGHSINDANVIFVNKIGVFAQKDYLKIIIPADTENKSNLPENYEEVIKPGDKINCLVVATQFDMKKENVSIWAEYSGKKTKESKKK